MSFAVALIVGCGAQQDQPVGTVAPTPAAGNSATPTPKAPSPTRPSAQRTPAVPRSHSDADQRTPSATTSTANQRPPRRSLSDLIVPGQEFTPGDALTPEFPPGELGGIAASTGVAPADGLAAVDGERVAAAGLRKLEGRYLVLYTDLPSAPEVDELPTVFDLAVPQWAEYFEIPAERFQNWRLIGCLIQVRERFERAGLLPDGLPPFTQGFQQGRRIWLHEQSTPYYRRHLLLHEGTHAVMNTIVGGSGPPWFSEGMSELLGTHRWESGRLALRYLPQNREEVSGWGRIKILRDDFIAGRGKALEQVMRYDQNAHLQVEPYGWCWGACYFLDSYPKTQAAFRALRRDVGDSSLDFSRRFYQQFRADWSEINEDWQLFLANIEYGYDVPRNVVQHRASLPLPAEGATVKVAVDRGWQSTGYVLETNRAYEFVASGRFLIAAEPAQWPCEAGGVTLRYHRGLPLGMLLGAVRPELLPPDKLTPLAAPDELGQRRRAVMERTGVLYVRINDAPGEMTDNRGELTLRIRRVEIGPTITNPKK